MKRSTKTLRALISEIQNSSNSQELLDLLDNIAAVGHKNSKSFLDSGDYEKAIREYSLLAEAYSLATDLAEDPSRFPELKRLSKSFRETTQYWNNQMEASKREGVAKYREEANKLFLNEDYGESINYYERALELDPSNSDLWIEDGNVYFSLGNYDRAIENYHKALELNPRNMLALNNLGLSLKNLSQYEEAIKYFDAAININPKDETFYLAKGEMLFRLKRFNEAMDAYSIATQINDRSANAWHDLGVSMIEGSFDYNIAKQHIEKALELEPDSMYFRASLAEALLLLKEYDESEKLASEVLENTLDEDYRYGMRLILVVSAYLRNSLTEGMEAALDLIKYYKSVSSKHEFSWTTNALKKTINESSLDPELKEVLLKLTSLHETSIDSDRNLVADNIRVKILATTMASKGRSYIRTLTDIPKKIRSAIGARRINAEEIIIVNTSSPSPTQPGYYNWEIYLDVPESILSQIDNVKYTLHPTFREREITINTKENRFRLSRMGWGEFNVKIDVTLKDGRTITKYHWLNLTG